MPRLARLFVPGCPVHIIQRGHNKQDIFIDDTDRLRFLDWVWEGAHNHEVLIHAWVLMSNHVHFAVSAPTSTALAKFGQFFSQRYSQYFNHRYQRNGTLWQGRFKSSPVVSDHYVLRLYRYIDLNPIRARLVSDPLEYRWSSYRQHVGLDNDANVSDHLLYWQLGNTPYDRQAHYRAFCDEAIEVQETAQMSHAVNAGWAMQLPEEMEKDIPANRSLRPARRGRPNKVAALHQNK